MPTSLAATAEIRGAAPLAAPRDAVPHQVYSYPCPANHLKVDITPPGVSLRRRCAPREGRRCAPQEAAMTVTSRQSVPTGTTDKRPAEPAGSASPAGPLTTLV